MRAHVLCLYQYLYRYNDRVFQTPCLVYIMDALVEKLEALLEWGGLKKDIAFLVISCAALVASFLVLAVT